MAAAGVDSAAFDGTKEVLLGDAFGMQALCADTFDVDVASAGEALAVVFFWGVDCFNCEIAKKAMLAQPEAIRALGLKWFHCNVYEHRELGRRFGLHGVPTWFFFHRGKRLGRATGWHGLAQFEAAVAAARGKIAEADAPTAVGPAPGQPASGAARVSGPERGD